MDGFNDVTGRIIIPPTNRMSGTVSITGVGKSELTSSITVTRYVNLNSRINVYNDQIIEDISYPPRFGNQRKAKINVPYRNDLSSSIGISPNNRMRGIVDIIEPPKFTTELTSTKDAFVRSGIPTLNYGTEQSMVVGYNAALNEKYRSLVEFPIDLLPTNITIVSASLKVYNNKLNNSTHQIGIYSAAAPWEEQGVAWISQPALKDISNIINIGNETGYSHIDVTDTVSKWYKGTEHNYGFIIKALNESYSQFEHYSTRENATDKPILEVVYRQNINFSAGRTDINANIFVYSVGKRELSGSIAIREYGNARDLPSSLHVYNFSYGLESRISVSRPDVQSKLLVRRSGLSVVQSSLAVRVKGGYLPQDNLQSQITVSAPYRIGHINVKERSIISASVVVRRTSDDSLQSNIHVSAPDRVGHINIKERSIIPGHVTVRVTGGYLPQDNLSANVTVSAPERVGHIYIRERSNISASLDVRVWLNDIVSLASTIAVSREQLLGSLVVRRQDSNEMDSSLTVKQIKNTTISSSITTIRRELKGNVSIILSSYLSSSITIKQKDNSTVQGTLLIPSRNNISGKMFVIYANMIPANIFVISGYLKSNIVIPAYGQYDQLGKMTVRVKWISELPSSMFVGGDNIPGGFVYII